jgi:RNA polymerase sigma-70 factor (ECF subfamily)
MDDLPLEVGSHESPASGSRSGRCETPDSVTEKARVLARAAADPDLALFERWRGGDQQAGQDLFARHFRDIYRFFKHKIDSRLDATADDLAQQTFLQCVRARAQFRHTSSFRTYLFAIARNELYQYVRRLPRGEHVDLEVSSLDEVISSPSVQLHRKQEQDRLIAALRGLPAEQQMLLELHYWHELDASALAEVFASQPGAIRVRLHRARLALRARLDVHTLDKTSVDPLSTSLQASELEDRPYPSTKAGS